MQKNNTSGLEQLWMTQGPPMDIASDQGTHFVSHEIQEWANKNHVHWHFHLPCSSTAAGPIERKNGLLSN